MLRFLNALQHNKRSSPTNMQSHKQREVQPHKGMAVASQSGQDKQESPMRGSPATRTKTSSLTPGHNDGSVGNDQEWKVVDHKDGSDDQRSIVPDRSNSMHFDVTLGEARWKHTLYSVDFNQSVQHACVFEHPDETECSCGFTQHESQQIKSTEEKRFWSIVNLHDVRLLQLFLV
ncbi:hypothetical protein N7474_000211 [Penicillium riverlandense]|uniref:uncharacterized protein n=1 Tax=Penicillium riverlandense TaxID=1903569 RepID=UPI0025496BEA|nr:uncharacterized protein N7474_000211 [Penicillium riverlandense]KAJ5831900.1 hypothetical protein N7474_000211 [Penicillium riverlandense]